MERMQRHILVMLALLLGAGATYAQEILFKAAVDRDAIATGDRIRLTITLSNTRERFEMPDIGGLMVLQGPYESSNVSIVNGRMSSEVTRTWILTATKPGSYTIGPAKLRVGNGVVQTDPITIEVSKGSGPPPTDPNAARGQARDPNLFTSITLSKTKVFVGEQVTATYTLYSRYNNIELTKYDLPEMTGFWAEEINTGNKGWEPQPQVVNGVPYNVAVLKRQVLFPQKSGKLNIEPMEISCVVNRSFFNRGTELTISSNPSELTVVPLPSPTPADFNGAVGELQMTVQADRTEVKANEAIQLQVRFNGKGNLKLLEAPALKLPVGFETYDPKVTDKITVNANGMSGSREFEYLLIPRHEGDHELPAIGFSYFDVKSGGYRQLSAPAIIFHVLPGEGGPASSAVHPGRTDVQVLEHDIRYIRTGDPGLRPSGRLLFGSAPWLAGMAAPAVAFVLFLGWHRKRERALADVTGTRRRLADRVARKHLAEAAKLVGGAERAPFHTALSKALQGYMADKFQLGPAQLTQPMVRERLAALPDGQALADRYVELVTACDMARFAPVEEVPRQQLYDAAAALIGRIENAHRA